MKATPIELWSIGRLPKQYDNELLDKIEEFSNGIFLEFKMVSLIRFQDILSKHTYLSSPILIVCRIILDNLRFYVKNRSSS